MIHSRWFRLVVIVVLMVAGGLFLWQYNQVDKPQLVNSDGRVFEKARVVDIVRDNLQEDGSRVGDQIVTLRMEDGPDAGQTVQANCPNGLLFGTVCQPGMAVIVISANVGAMGVHTVYNVDRSLPIYLYVAAFLVLLSVIGGKKRCQIRRGPDLHLYLLPLPLFPHGPARYGSRRSGLERSDT